MNRPDVYVEPQVITLTRLQGEWKVQLVYEVHLASEKGFSGPIALGQTELAAEPVADAIEKLALGIKSWINGELGLEEPAPVDDGSGTPYEEMPL
jgi:hypothetical protein